jgi:hypothetical protein
MIEAFERLMGRPATDEERADLHAAIARLPIKDRALFQRPKE